MKQLLLRLRVRLGILLWYLFIIRRVTLFRWEVDLLEGDMAPKCSRCNNPATCLGEYEGHGGEEYACDTCCGHGNEDGHCRLLAEHGDLEETT